MGNSCFTKKPADPITSKVLVSKTRSVNSDKGSSVEEILPDLTTSNKLISWKLGERVAETRFCKIFQSINTKTGELLTLKSYQIFKSSSAFFTYFKRIRKETQILKSLNHPNIIKLIQIENSGESIDIITECIPNGCLEEIIERYKALEETVVKRYLAQVIEAVEYLNRLSISHNNLSSRSVYITSDGVVKVAGFKNSTYFNVPVEDGEIVINRFLAPEVINGKVHEKSDVWSIGCLAMLMLTGTLPFSYLGNDDLLKKIGMRAFDVVLPKCSDMLKVFILACLNFDPERRPSITELSKFEAINGKKFNFEFWADENMKMSLNKTADCHQAILEMDNE